MKIIECNSYFIRNPYPYYADMLNAEAPIWLPATDKKEFDGIWLFSKYIDAEHILKLGSDNISKQIEKIIPNPTPSILDKTMLNMDPPEHRKLRNLASKAFSTSALSSIEPKIKEIADSLLKKAKLKNKIDFIKEVALPLPVGVIAFMMGVPDDDQENVRGWAVDVLNGIDSSNNSIKGVLENQRNGYQNLSNYFISLIAKKDSNPDDSVCSKLNLAFKEKQISFEELVRMCVFLLIVGYETTVGLLGNGLYCLLRNPKQLYLLKSDLSLLDNAIEEMLRYESPFQRTSFRVTVKGCLIGRHTYNAGEQIGVVIGAANRDPSLFENPDVFDITRIKNKHIAFGLGIHSCLGAYLARLEARILFTLLLCSTNQIELAEQPIWNNNSVIRNLNSLKIEFL